MSFATQLRDYLRLDATLMALTTGGVYTTGDTKRQGLDRSTVPDAFDATTRKLKPTVVVHARSQMPYGGVRDQVDVTVSARQVLEIYLYDDGDRGYLTIESARRRIRQLLDYKRLPGIVMIKWINNIDDEKAEELNNANMIRADYEVIAIKNV